MKEREKVGLYLGVNSVGVAVIRGKKVVSLANFELSSLEGAQAEALSEDIRWEALINKVLRHASADAKDVYISLADKDFIFRSLEMPLMKKREVESSLIYEIEKYIPFKIEELEWDYGYVRFPKEKKINLSFVGIRENNIQRVKDILYRLKINAANIEPSCLSLLRVIKSSKKLAEFKNFALLDFTVSEAYLTFFQNDLPVFNRYLIVPKKEEGFDLREFIEAVSLSFQYFKSEFKTYELEKIIVAGGAGAESLIPSLEETLQIEAAHIGPGDLSVQSGAEIESIKALGAAGKDSYSYEFKPVLRKTKEFAEGMESAATVPSLRLGMLGFLLVLGMVGLFFLSIFLGSEISVEKNKAQKEEKDLTVPKEFREISWGQREEQVETLRSKVKVLKKIKSSFEGLSGFLDSLSRRDIILPDGVWLENLSIRHEQKEYTGILEGCIFYDDNYQERLALDQVVANLKGDKEVGAIFSSVEIDFSKRKQIKDVEVTSFSLKLKGRRKK